MSRGFGQFCPVAMASEVFAERWTPMILRELEASGVLTSTPASKGRGREYRLTESGEEFRAAIDALGAWGQRWTIRVQPDRLDPGLLMWNVRRRIAAERLPSRRTVVRFDFEAVPVTCRGPRTFWLLLEPSAIDLCLSDPGMEVDVYVDADLGAMTAVWLGDLSFSAAVRADRIRLTGRAPLVRQFPSWLRLSHFAGVPRPRVPG